MNFVHFFGTKMSSRSSFEEGTSKKASPQDGQIETKLHKEIIIIQMQFEH